MVAIDWRKCVAKNPWRLFRYNRAAFLEWFLIAVIITLYMLAGFYWSDVGYNLTNSFNNNIMWVSILGIISWVFTYGTFAIFGRICGCCDKCEGELGVGEEDYIVLAVLLHIVYHLIRWPILLILAYINNPIAMAIGYWLELMVLIVYGIYNCIYNCRC